MSAQAYLRSRRLAYVVAGAALLLLALWILAGRVPDAYARPTLLTAGSDWHIIHEAHRGETDDVIGIALTLDPATLKTRSRRELFGGVTAAATRSGTPVLFYGTRYAALGSDGSSTLPWSWTVRTASGTESSLWVAGVDAPPVPGAARVIKAGRIDADGPLSDERVAAPSADIDQLMMLDGPDLVWREGAATVVRVARRSDVGWQELESIDLGAAVRWTALKVGRRILVVSFVREDRAWGSATLRVSCCRACGLPPPPSRWTFRDPLLFGRPITGIAAAVADDRIVVTLTRTSTIHIVSVPRESLQPAPDAKLAAVGAGMPWGQAVVLLWLCVMLSLALALVYLGAVLMRERRRFILAALGARAPAGPRPAGIFARTMAFIVDFMILLPVHLFVVESLELEPPGPDVPLGRAWPFLAVLWGTHVAYFTILEAFFGKTAGKRLIGLRVESAAGGRASLLQILVRNVIRIVDVYIASGLLAVVFMAFTKRRQRLGDLAARTVVLHDDPGIQAEDAAGVSLRSLLERAVQRERGKK